MFDYKKIIRSRAVRLKILRFLNCIPDKAMLCMQYRIKTGRRLNLKTPTRYTEKIQWYKLNYKNPLMIQCVDKYDVREYVKSKGLGSILIPCYGVYDSFEQIDWNGLPEQFVIKDTLGGGGNSVIIVKDKSNENIEKIREEVSKWVSIKAHRKDAGREWPYYSGKNHRIIIEEYIDSSKTERGLIDYKFFCFNGIVKFLQVMTNRDNGNSVNCTLFDEDFNRLSVKSLLHDVDEQSICKPIGFDRAKKIAEHFAKDFPHVRVDLYIEGNTVAFGELTFYGASGYYSYDPDSFDFELGEAFDITAIK